MNINTNDVFVTEWFASSWYVNMMTVHVALFGLLIDAALTETNQNNALPF